MREQIDAVADRGALFVLPVVGIAVLVAVVLVLGAHGCFTPQELKSVGPLLIALVVCMFGLGLSFGGLVIWAIWPRRSAADLAIARRHEDLGAEVARAVERRGSKPCND